MDKVYYVIALLDNKATSVFRGYQNLLSLAESGNSALPHLTIALYDREISVDGLILWTENIADTHKRFKVTYTAIGIAYAGGLVAIPSFSNGLYSLYRDQHQRYDECCRDYSALKNDIWMPHTGILYEGTEAACEKIAELAKFFRPVEAEIIALRVTEFDGTNFRKLAEFALRE